MCYFKMERFKNQWHNQAIFYLKLERTSNYIECSVIPCSIANLQLNRGTEVAKIV